MTPRHPSIDISRGIAMILVVFGHALIGVMAAVGETALARFLVILVYTSHMPLFFALSGALSGRLMALLWWTFLSELSRRILWPYVLWSVLILSAHYLMRQHTNTMPTGFRPWVILWQPPAVMWFLWVLGLSFVARRLLVGLPKRVVALIGLGTLMAAYALTLPIGNARFVGVFLIATLIPLRWFTSPPSAALLGGAALVMIATAGLAWHEASTKLIGYPAGAAIYLPAMVAGPVLLLSASHVLAKQSALRFTVHLSSGLAAIGRHSMAIFVTHIFVTAGVRILLQGVGVDAFWTLVASCTVAGVMLPLWISRWADAIGASPLLGWQR
ncbi:acyltransferase family protein [Cognatishimia maritima]|uniref:Acyltransferase family protein n=1 Tax=Cognatishimia maritima TaxID=870908 RepID=A0A1M5N8L8_9RHOB|nr:acyltransferase family protein [Cognatishimia maritima]SHG85827.1 Acyltransferase family protein [Cognatishimia maritima]